MRPGHRAARPAVRGPGRQQSCQARDRCRRLRRRFGQKRNVPSLGHQPQRVGGAAADRRQHDRIDRLDAGVRRPCPPRGRSGLAAAPPCVRTRAPRAARRAMSRRMEIGDTRPISFRSWSMLIGERVANRSKIRCSRSSLIIMIGLYDRHAETWHRSRHDARRMGAGVPVSISPGVHGRRDDQSDQGELRGSALSRSDRKRSEREQAGDGEAATPAA